MMTEYEVYLGFGSSMDEEDIHDPVALNYLLRSLDSLHESPIDIDCSNIYNNIQEIKNAKSFIRLFTKHHYKETSTGRKYPVCLLYGSVSDPNDAMMLKLSQ